MADLLLHLAVGVFVASRFRFERLPRYLVALAAVLPDLDALFGRFVLWRGATWFGWSGEETHSALVVGGHGGALHSLATVFAVFLLVWLFSQRWRVGAAVAVAWLSHALLDVFTTGQPVLLWWPIAHTTVSNPLIVAWEPVLVVLSVFFLGGTLMGDAYLFDKEKELGERTRLILRKFGPRLAKGAAQMIGFIVLFLLASKILLLATDPLEGSDVVAAGFPDYNIHERTEGGYLVTLWDSFGEARVKTVVPEIPPALTGPERDAAVQGLCVAHGLMGVVAVHHPVVLRADDLVVVGSAGAATDHAGSGSTKVLVFVPNERGDGITRAWTAHVGDPRDADLEIPIGLVATTGC